MSGSKSRAAKGPAAFTHKPHGGTADRNAHAAARGDGVEKKKRELEASRAKLLVKQAEAAGKAAAKVVADAKKAEAAAKKASMRRK